MNAASVRPFFISALVLCGWLLLIEWNALEQELQKDSALLSQRETVQDETQLAYEQGLNNQPANSLLNQSDSNSSFANPPNSEESSGLISLQSTTPSVAIGDSQASAFTAATTSFSSDTLKLKIDLQSGDIAEVVLLGFPQYIDTPENPIVLLDRNGPYQYFARASYQNAQGKLYTYNFQELSRNDDGITVSLTLQARTANGLQVTRTIRSDNGSYVVHIEDQLANVGVASVQAHPISALYHNGILPPSELFLAPPSYTGPAYKDNNDRYNKYDFDDIKEDGGISRQVKGPWIAIIQHYFLSAWAPQANEERGLQLHHLKKRDNSDQYVIGLVANPIVLAPNETATHTDRLYVGPKIQDTLKDVSAGLDLTVDYGWLWWIGQPIYAILELIFNFVGNWGIAIILFTILLKLAIYPLSAAGFRSMARLRKLTPRMKELQERYKGDRQKLGQATMEMYKEHKVNPLGGCLPLLIPMPIFLALYWVLLESVELRHANFGLWIDDLSARDPYFVLPLLMGLSMWVTQKLSPQPTGMDPTMQTMLRLMPFIFTLFLLAFPAGLVLYWLFNNLMSIGQQWVIQKQIEREDAA